MIYITFKYRHRKAIIIASLLILVTIITTTSIVYMNRSNKKEDEQIVLEKKPIKKADKNDDMYKVDIKGQVVNPGIYSLSINSRVIDVIEKAGGLTENADTTVINLSKKISDEMVIIIYSYEEVKEFGKTKEKESRVLMECKNNEIYSIENNACIETKETPLTSGKININTATKEELMTLPGIGESKANDIIKYREANGQFKSIEELTNINGIGENILAKIKENITT